MLEDKYCEIKAVFGKLKRCIEMSKKNVPLFERYDIMCNTFYMNNIFMIKIRDKQTDQNWIKVVWHVDWTLKLAGYNIESTFRELGGGVEVGVEVGGCSRGKVKVKGSYRSGIVKRKPTLLARG